MMNRADIKQFYNAVTEICDSCKGYGRIKMPDKKWIECARCEGDGIVFFAELDALLKRIARYFK